MDFAVSRRADRRYEFGPDDERTPFGRDRDRIMYSGALRRLSGVTQVVRAGEADIFHNRLVHTIKVAQVGRRLAEDLGRKQAELARQMGLDPDAVEAACLAHDLGHPPFGHIGEETLNSCVVASNEEGFEGNAQSFSIVTRLSVRYKEIVGLNLTRATLSAIIKYPWAYDVHDRKKSKKWGYYKEEKSDFNFAREWWPLETKTVEAEIMDYADDITYSIHDLEDFTKCGLIPWNSIMDGGAHDAIVRRARDTWIAAPADAEKRLEEALKNLVEHAFALFQQVLLSQYDGSRDQRWQMRAMTSLLVGNFIKEISLVEPKNTTDRVVNINPHTEDKIRILKEIARSYIIENPSLMAQQRGHKQIVKYLFECIKNDSTATTPPSYIPKKFSHMFGSVSHARAVADCIASLSEAEATALHARLTGAASGAVWDPIVR